LPAFLAIVNRHPNGAVLVVSHKATIRLVIGELLGVELRGYRDRLDMSPCGLNILDVKSGAEARLVLYNDVSHYATVTGPTGKRLSPWWAWKRREVGSRVHRWPFPDGPHIAPPGGGRPDQGWSWPTEDRTWIPEPAARASPTASDAGAPTSVPPPNGSARSPFADVSLSGSRCPSEALAGSSLGTSSRE
jgi:hypothetical protein